MVTAMKGDIFHVLSYLQAYPFLFDLKTNIKYGGLHI